MALGGSLSLLFGLREPVPQKAYAAWGVGLLGLKFAGDYALAKHFAGGAIGLLTWLNPFLSLRLEAFGQYPDELPVALAVWSVPFIWIDVSMTARRALDAGRAPWLCALFFVPILNCLLMLGLCFAKRVERGSTAPPVLAEAQPELTVALKTLLVASCIGVLAALLSLFVSDVGEPLLLIAAPFALSALSGALYNRVHTRTAYETLQVSAFSVLLVGGGLSLIALESLLAFGMVAPLAIPLAVAGSLLGRAWETASA